MTMLDLGALLARQHDFIRERLQRLDRGETVPPDALAGGEVSARVRLQELQAVREEIRLRRDALQLARESLGRARAAADESFFEAAPLALLVTDANGTIRRANVAAGEMLGRAPRRTTGKPLVLFVAAEERRGFRLALARTCEAADAQEWPMALAPRGAPRREARVTARAIRGGDGRPSAIYWAMREESEAWPSDLL
ncbi:MAG TPA: PAS domain-containing protein [Gemmatimonadaceae bacterium]|nr:PAS domain-containing protein [Gemmatimonadaceae bacterium]